MNFKQKYAIRFFVYLFILILGNYGLVLSAVPDWQGQVSGWSMANMEKPAETQLGIRYLPGVALPFYQSDTWQLDTEISANLFAHKQLWNDESQNDAKLYRCWLRLSSNRFEARAGLQKINFGSAFLLRPLMWFDSLDPRDPLQMTEGVYALLARYYLQNNANIWLWALYGNDELKGSEFLVTKEKSTEYGGRLQYPLGHGEMAFTYHYRNADVNKSIALLMPGLPKVYNFDTVKENRLAVDGKWDYKVTFWFEAAAGRFEPGFMNYEYLQQGTAGMDYTFSLGNGLHILYEHFVYDISDKLQFSDGTNYSAAMADYPLNMLDYLSGIVFIDHEQKQNYYFVSWRRSYDKWLLNLIVFMNPEQQAPVSLMQNRNLTAYSMGNGVQFLLVFNY